MNNSYITIIKEKRTVLSRKRVPLNQNECTADFGIGVPFEQNLHRKTVSVCAESPEQAKEKTKIILFDTDLINFTDADFVCGEADITEQSEDGLDGAGENTLQENEDCSDCPYFCPVCGECMYEEDCEE